MAKPSGRCRLLRCPPLPFPLTGAPLLPRLIAASVWIRVLQYGFAGANGPVLRRHDPLVTGRTTRAGGQAAADREDVPHPEDVRSPSGMGCEPEHPPSGAKSVC